MATEKINLGRVRGFGVFTWDSVAGLENITQIEGAKLGDSIINTGLTTVEILGIDAEVGGIVRIITATEGELTGNIGGFNVFPWSEDEELTSISQIPGAKLGDSIINTGKKTVGILGVPVEVGGIIRITWDEHYTCAPIENTRGFGVHAWGNVNDVTNIAQIVGARIEDYIVNTQIYPVNIFGQVTQEGEIIKIVAAEAGEKVLDIDGASVFVWKEDCDLENIDDLLGAKLDDFIINTKTNRKIFGEIVEPNSIVRIGFCEDYTRRNDGNIGGFNVFPWNEINDLEDIYQIEGAKLGDSIVNTGMATRTILGQHVEVGGIVRIMSATTCNIVGNIGGFSIFTWNEDTEVTNVSQITGAKIGDSIINTGTKAISILGISAEIGDIIKIEATTAGATSGNIRGIEMHSWNLPTAFTDISQISGLKIGDSIINTGATPVSILGVIAEVGGIIKATTATTGITTGNIRGISVHTWNSASNVTNISQVNGMVIGDSIVNTGVSTINILGVVTEIGGMVRILSATTGEPAGNIRGLGVHTWNSSTSLTNISQIPGVRVDDSIINTGATTVSILGINTQVGEMIKVLSATGGEPAGNIKGLGMYTWDSTNAVTNISQIPGIRIDDLIVNTARSTVNILGESAEIGGIVKVVSQTQGIHVGNIRGAQGETGAIGPQGIPGENAIANINASGPWDEVTTYMQNDLVTCNEGNSYISLRDNILGVYPPDNPESWSRFVAQGAKGEQGFSVFAWNTANNVTNISQVSGMAIGDLIVNTGAATRVILGVSTAIGGMVRAIATTAGVAAGSIRGPHGMVTVVDNLSSLSVTEPLSANQGRVLNESKANIEHSHDTKDIGGLLEALYPVGSIYLSTNSTNPSAVFGGTWIAWGQGRVPVGVDSNDVDFVQDMTGGNKAAVVVSHNHSASSGATAHSHGSFTSGSTAHSHGSFATTWSGNHIHSVPGGGTTGGGIGNGARAAGSSTLTNSAGDHQHSVNISGGGSHSHSVNISGGGSHNHTITVNNSGVSGSNANLQPYITCFMWTRTH